MNRWLRLGLIVGVLLTGVVLLLATGTLAHIGQAPIQGDVATFTPPSAATSARLDDTPIRVYPLLTGSTWVPYGQFYGDGAGWTGLRGAVQLATAAAYIEVPIYAYLIDHPQAGLILFDAGISQRQSAQHDTYYQGLFSLGLPPDEYVQTPAQEVADQVRALGYAPEQVSTIVLSHLHEDHVGALYAFPQATVVLSRAEWDARYETVLLGVRPLYYFQSFADVARWQLVDFTSGPLHDFAASQDLLGDGTLWLVPTPGHSAGHAGLLVRNADHQIYLAGDAIYTLRHLSPQLRPLISNAGRVAVYDDSVRRVAGLRNTTPTTLIVPSHDHYDYQFRLVAPALADGLLTPQEQTDILDYADGLFDAEGRLVPDAMPRYVPGEGTRGEVVAAIP